MKRLEQYIGNYLFAPIGAEGFSLMRIGWALLQLFTYLTHWFSYKLYYATDGIFGVATCTLWRCAIHNIIFAEPAIHLTFALLIASLTCVLFGIKPRVCILISLVLIICFHQRNPLILNGGDRVEKAMAFLLLIAPNIHLHSVKTPKKCLTVFGYNAYYCGNCLFCT